MPNQDQNAPVTVRILKETLGEFTEEVVLPAVQKIVKDEVRTIVKDEVRTIVKDEVNSALGPVKTELKDYIDTKLGSLRGDLISVMRGEWDRNRHFKTKMVEIVERNKLAKDDEVSVLRELAR